MNNDLTFFTNDENDSLLERFKTTLKDAKTLDILVGYFRSSGFHLLHDDLEDIDKIRILIGLNADNETVKLVKKTKEQMALEMSHKKKKNNITNKIIKEMNVVEDNYQKEKGIRKFIELLEKNKLELRFYPKADIHAKVYIQLFGDNDRDFGRVITGSSNFSYSGLLGNREFNVELKNKYDTQFALEKFEELWKEGIDLSEEYIDTIKKKTWLKDDISPYNLYLKFLYEYFKEELENDKEDLDLYLPDNFMKLKYQEEAVESALGILEKYNGVFLSDVVGLGKTFISALLSQELKGRILIVCPPALIEYWEDTFGEFGVRNYRVESLGMLDHISQRYGNDYFDYIFVDEAHRFRNEKTQRYEQLFEICYGNKVILVSATPLNNYIGDIYSQLKLFQVPRNSDIPGVKNLDKFFASCKGELNQYKVSDPNYNAVKKKIYKKVRDKVLRHVMVRRTRTEIENYYEDDIKKQGLSFPNISDPKRIIYQFDVNTNEVFEKTIMKLKKLEYARYQSIVYLKNPVSDFEKQSYINIGGFMKTLVVKRLESSFYAFNKTIGRFIDSYEKFIDMYESGAVYISKEVDVYELLDSDNEEELIKLVEEEKAQKYKSKEFYDEFYSKLNNDLRLLREIKELWSNVDNDPKLNCFIDNLKNDDLLKDNRIIVFTESTETGEYLYRELNKVFSNEVFFYSSKGGLFRGDKLNNYKSKELIKESYDPTNNTNNNKIRLLITTDVLAE
ncbi:SNF2-related protein, partial [Halanaerobium congolense]